MLLNRRAMLTAGIGAVALSLSGCKNTKTTVIIVNGAAEKLTVSATAGSISLSASNIQPGHQVKKTNNSNVNLGTIVPVVGNATLATTPPTMVPLGGLDITAGYTNTITIVDFGPPVIMVS